LYISARLCIIHIERERERERAYIYIERERERGSLYIYREIYLQSFSRKKSNLCRKSHVYVISLSTHIHRISLSLYVERAYVSTEIYLNRTSAARNRRYTSEIACIWI